MYAIRSYYGIINLGNEIRVGNFKSQAKRDPAIFEEAIKKFPEVYTLLEDIRKYTKEEVDMKDLDEIEDGATSYKKAMEEFIADWKKREELATLRNEAGKELIAACAATTEAGLAGTQNIANDAISLLKTSNTAMVSGLLIALLIGVVFAVFLTRAITGPVNKGVLFAQRLSDGDLTATINVV